jgi:hypothetical protein
LSWRPGYASAPDYPGFGESAIAGANAVPLHVRARCGSHGWRDLPKADTGHFDVEDKLDVMATLIDDFLDRVVPRM